MPRKLCSALLALLDATLAFAALEGGAELIRAPDGSGLGLSLALLKGTPFADFFWPGLLLAAVVGVVAAAGAVLSLSLDGRGRWVHPVPGLVLGWWMVAQLALIGYQLPLQLVMLGFAVVLTALGFVRASPSEHHWVGDDPITH